MTTWSQIMNFEEDEDALVIELYAQQWNWKARYAGEDNVLGDANVRFLNLDHKMFYIQHTCHILELK